MSSTNNTVSYNDSNILTFYIFVYVGAGSYYAAIFIGFLLNMFSHIRLAKKITAFQIIGGYILFKIFDMLLQIAGLYSIESDNYEDSVNLFIIAATITTLLSTCFIYIIMTLLCKGLSVTRTAIPPLEKQTAVLLGISMMIVEVLVNGERIYTIGVLFIYFLLLRMSSFQILQQLSTLQRQIAVANVK